MSWDVLLMNAEGAPASVAEMTNAWRAKSMGSADEVRQQIRQALPEVNLTDLERGHLSGGGYSIRFRLPMSGEVDSIMLHIRGSGDALSAVIHLCKVNHWVALDTSTVAFINLDGPSSESWQEFQKYRDHVLKNSP